MTLNELLERKRSEFDAIRAHLNELAGDCFLSKEDLCSNPLLMETSKKIDELSIEIMLLENLEEILYLDKTEKSKDKEDNTLNEG